MSNRIAIILIIFALFTVINADNECIASPFNQSCKSYEMPDDMIENVIDQMCTSMPSMPSCDANSICLNPDFSGGSYCSRFAILQAICEDMTGSSLCTNLTLMCRTGSVVQQCSTNQLPLPTSIATQNYINSICSQMTMPECAQCEAPSNAMTCNTLQVYSNLCKTMPSMTECSSWKMICSLVPNWPLCSTTSTFYTPEPVMEMYLHTQISDYILFKNWVPRTSGQYAGTLFAVIVFGIISEVLKLLRCWCDNKWIFIDDDKKRSSTDDLMDDIIVPPFKKMLKTPFRRRVDIPRAGLRAFEMFWSIMVMLIVMTFNVGIIFAMCFGVFLGNMLVGRYIETRHAKPSSNCCEM